MRNHQDFVRIAVVENMQRSRFLKKLAPLPSAASDLVTTIRDILERGAAAMDSSETASMQCSSTFRFCR